MEALEAIRILEGMTGSSFRKTTKGWLGRCPCHPDRSPSLGVLLLPDGRAFFRCWSGCDAKDIVRAIKDRSCRYDPKEVPYKETNKVPPWDRIPTEVYDYSDRNGRLLFQKLRFEDKSFSVRVPTGNKRWRWSLSGTLPVLYNLPALNSPVVAIAEGEKDADTLTDLGVPCTTNYDGAYAGKWRNEYNAHLHNKHVLLFADNDEPGQRHAEYILKVLRSEPLLSLTFMHPLPGLAHHQDVTDWVNLGAGMDDIIDLFRAKGGPEEAVRYLIQCEPKS